MAGGGSDTLHGPAADTTWTISGAGSGTVAGTSFGGFANLSGAAGNKDTFDFEPGRVARAACVDGGDGGFDTLKVTGNKAVSTPTDAHSGTVVARREHDPYAGLEPVDMRRRR